MALQKLHATDGDTMAGMGGRLAQWYWEDTSNRVIQIYLLCWFSLFFNVKKGETATTPLHLSILEDKSSKLQAFGLHLQSCAIDASKKYVKQQPLLLSAYLLSINM